MSKAIKVDELTIEGIVYVPKDSIEKTIVKFIDGTECAYKVGEKYLIRTVTMIQLGRVKQITGRSILLENACWVADTGRFSESLKDGTLKEVEMFASDAIVSFGAIVDATIWTNDLPTKTK